VSKIQQYNASEKLAILKEYETSRTTLVNILEKYNIAKRTFYSWRRQYKLYGNKGLEIRTHGGEDSLKDGRGREKAPEKLSEIDRQKLSMKKLERENERLRAENLYINFIV
jgi:transposase